ncbi:MAG: PD40 domain-containing protein, partial [Calditrichia bacterium]|nr:PD40 domain-containing protein [Calditrichia bacterium]
GYQSLYLYSTIQNKIVDKLIKGTRSESFEELHLLRPGITFSPDSKKVAFTAKSKGNDWIYIKDLKKGDVEKFKIELDGVYTVSWSPDGQNIAFVGNHNETSDIYLLNLETSKIKNVTNDVFSDDMPSWSPEGDKIIFVSNRMNYIDNSQLPEDFSMTDYNYSQKDIYEIELESNTLTRITETDWNEQFPVYIEDDNNILFTSYENGVSNIYHYDLLAQQKRPLSNVVTGVFQLSLTRDFKKLAFVSFSYGGFDIFTVNNPLKLNVKEMQNTHFVNTYDDFEKDIKGFYKNKKNENIDGEGKKPKRKSDAIMKKDYDKFVFGPNLYGDKSRKKEQKKEKEDLLELPQNRIMTDDGEYYVRKYKINLSPDYVVAQAGYNTYFGVQGYTQFSFSDLLGNYQILLNTNLYYDLRNSTYAITLLNLKHRVDYGISGYHYANYFYSGGLIRYRNYGANIFGSYGFSRYRRVDFGLVWYNVSLEYLDAQIDNQAVSTFLPQVNYVFDNVLYGYTGPVAGTRYYFSMLMSPDYSSNSRDFKSITGDFRKYFMVNRNYQFAARLTGGVSFGKNPQQYFLGGIDNWINRKFKGGMKINMDDIYFSSFVTPLRGAYYYERAGDRFLLTNLEFRFPLINILSLGFPPVTFGNIRGVAFTDIGTAWYDGDKLKLFERDALDNLKTKDLVAGYGVGARLYFLGFLMRFDVAWRYDIERSHHPIFYFSLGGDI